MALHFSERSAMAKGTEAGALRSRGHETFIKVLVEARDRSGITQRDLAARIKQPHSFVGRM
jgi:ribosome-binding protein aMBF1 (putative translation factor)